MTFILRNRTLFLETGKYFGISQNEIEDKKSGTEGVYIYINPNKKETLYH